MISEGSFDAEVMITGINYILKYILMKKTVILNCNNISQYYCFYCIFDPINVSLVSIGSFKKNTKIILIDPKIYIL